VNLRIHPGIFAIALAGCAVARQAPRDDDPFPLDLAGNNTHLRFVLGSVSANSSDDSDGLLADQELCYLSIDHATIECFPFGSLLMLGPDDAVELVADNPLDDLHADGRDPGGDSLLRTLSTFSLIAASIDRVPDSLADYMADEDAENPAVARALALRLLQPGGTTLTGYSGSATFTINVELTDDGRETLEEALADSQSSGGLLVRGGDTKKRR
jgi:hypothetical protein